MKPTTVLIVVAGLFNLLSPQSTSSQDQFPNYSYGYGLVEVCLPIREPVTEWALCTAFIQGAIEGIALHVGAAKDPALLFCVPDTATNAQIRDVIVKYFLDHPEHLDQPSVKLIESALKTTWPGRCKG